MIWDEKALSARDQKAWAMREKGMRLDKIGEALPRADSDNGETGVTKARAWQIVQREFTRRVDAAETEEEVERLFGVARMGSLKGIRDAALRRIRQDEAA